MTQVRIDKMLDRTIIGRPVLAQTCVDERSAQVRNVIDNRDVSIHAAGGDRDLNEMGGLLGADGDELVSHWLNLGVPACAFDHRGDDPADDAFEQLPPEDRQFGDEVGPEIAGDRCVVHGIEPPAVEKQGGAIWEVSVDRVSPVPGVFGDSVVGDRIPAVCNEQLLNGASDVGLSPPNAWIVVSPIVLAVDDPRCFP